jgi:hypothetical protein
MARDRRAANAARTFGTIPSFGSMRSDSLGQTFTQDDSDYVDVRITDDGQNLYGLSYYGQPVSCNGGFAGYSGDQVQPGPCGTWTDIPENERLQFGVVGADGKINNPLFEAGGATDVPIGTVVKAYRGYQHGDDEGGSVKGQEYVFFAGGGGGGGSGGLQIEILDQWQQDPDTGIWYAPAIQANFRPNGSPAGEFLMPLEHFNYLWAVSYYFPGTDTNTVSVGPALAVGAVYNAAPTGEKIVLDYGGTLPDFTDGDGDTPATHPIVQVVHRAEVEVVHTIGILQVDDRNGYPENGNLYITDWDNQGGALTPPVYMLGAIGNWDPTEPGSYDEVAFVFLTTFNQDGNVGSVNGSNGAPLPNVPPLRAATRYGYLGRYMRQTVSFTVDLQNGPATNDTPPEGWIPYQNIVTITADLYEITQYPSCVSVACDGDGNVIVNAGP